MSPESPRNHSNHVDSNNGIKNVYHRTCLSYFERRRTRMFILLVKNKLVLCPQTSSSRTTKCVRSRDFLVFTAWRQKDARKQMAGAAVETTANDRSWIRFKVLNLRIRWEPTWKSEWLKTTNWIALRGVRVEIAFLGTLSICTQKYWFRKTATLRSMLKSVLP